ncbi:MAG: hypothetical protein MI749_20430, partial [Desulfovibrionales bacterium]|nr:hypothetical protein [Desulfovibrionales bacterium]
IAVQNGCLTQIELHSSFHGGYTSSVRNITASCYTFSNDLITGHGEGDIQVRRITSHRIPGLMKSTLENSPVRVRHSFTGKITCFAESPVTKEVAVGTDDGHIQLLEPFTYQHIKTIKLSEHPQFKGSIEVLSLQYHPVQPLLVSLHQGSTPAVWNKQTGEFLYHLEQESEDNLSSYDHGNLIMDNGTVIAASKDKIAAWCLDNNGKLLSTQSIQGITVDKMFMENNQLIVSGYDRGKVTLHTFVRSSLG